MEKEDIRRYSSDDLAAMHDRGDIIPTSSDAQVYPIDDDFWSSARVVMPGQGKAHVNMRVDRDVLDWFRQQGKGHLTRMNAVLRSFMEAHKS